MARVRIKRAPVESNAPTKHMKDLSNSISEAQDWVAKYIVAIEKDSEELQKLMEAKGILKVSASNSEANLVTPKGRVTQKVRPKDFKGIVSEDDFMDSVSVTITAAKKVLSEKELKKVVDIIEPKAKEAVLKVTGK